ncbi:MAG: DUF835 domain-containing protein [Thermoplasmata archaeon]
MVQGVGLGNLILTALDGDDDGFNDFVEVKQEVLCDAGGTYNVTAKLYPPSVDYVGSPDAHIDIAWWRQSFSSCAGVLTINLNLYTTFESPVGTYNVTVVLTHSTITPAPNSTLGQVFLYPKRKMSLDLGADAPVKESEPGTSVSYTVSVTNRGNFPEDVDLRASTPSNWSVDVSPFLIAVDVGETVSVNVTILVPENAVLETTERVEVEATSRVNSSYSRVLYLDIGVGMADPMVLTDDVTFSKANPSAGETVKVRIVVRNGGSKDAVNVKVALYQGSDLVDSVIVQLLPKGGKASVEISWTASVGDHLLVAMVDPDEEIIDLDRTNNRVEKSVSVGGSTNGGNPGGYEWLLLVAIVVGGLLLAILLVATGTLKMPKHRGMSPGPTRTGIPVSEPLKAEKIEPGKAYLLEEEKPEHVVELFKRLGKGDKGLVVTRANPERLIREKGLKAARLLWLADRASPSDLYEVVAPSLERLMYTIEVHAREVPSAVVMIDGVEYLVDNNNFNAVLRFLRRLVDLASQTEATLLVSLSPRALSERELKILEREMEVFRLV